MDLLNCVGKKENPVSFFGSCCATKAMMMVCLHKSSEMGDREGGGVVVQQLCAIGVVLTC